MCRVCRSDMGIVLNARSVEYAEFVDQTWAVLDMRSVNMQNL